jgi:hypothetical protein
MGGTLECDGSSASSSREKKLAFDAYTSSVVDVSERGIGFTKAATACRVEL